MSLEKVVIIIPTFNEAPIIKDTIAQLLASTAHLSDIDFHVLIFDSASTDNTQAIVTKLQTHHNQLHLITESQKTGLGSAYMQAMRYALTTLVADIIIEFDADLSHQPKYIAPMLEKLKTHDVVIGSRYVLGGCIPNNWGWDRKFFSILGNKIARLVLTSHYKDFTSGFRMTRRRALANALPKHFLSNQYAYKLHLLWLLHKNKTRIFEYPIEFIDREKGVSKLPTNSIFDSLRVIFTLRYKELEYYFTLFLIGTLGTLIQGALYSIL